MSQEKISAKVLYAIFATGILSFCGVAGETAMNITFPILMKEFEINTATVQWVTTIYLLVVACVVPLVCLSQTLLQNEVHLFSWKSLICLRCSH